MANALDRIKAAREKAVEEYKPKSSALDRIKAAREKATTSYNSGFDTEIPAPSTSYSALKSEEDNEDAEERNFLGRTIDFLKRGSDARADAYKATADYYKANAGKPTIGGYLGEKAVGGALETVEGNVNTLAYLQQLMAKGYEMQAANAMGHAGAVTGNEYIDEQARKQQAEALEHLHTPTETVANFGDRFTGKTEEKYADADFGALTRFAGDVAQGFGGMVPVMAANALLPGAGQAVMAAGAFGNAAQEAKKQGKTGMDVAAYAAATAAVEYATEKIWGGMGGIMGKGALDDVVKKAIENGVKNGAARAGLTALVSVLGEGIEEFLAEYGGLIANKLSIKTDTRTALEALPDAGRAALVGGILGGLLNAGEFVQAGQSVSPEQAADAAVAEMENSAQIGVSPEMGMDIPKAENADMPHPGAPGFEEDQGARATVENNMKQFADFDAYWKDLQKRKALAEHRERYAEGESVHPAIEAVKAIEAEERAAVNMRELEQANALETAMRQRVMEQAKKTPGEQGYGEYGAKALSKVMEDYGLDENTADAMFKSAYEAGRVELAREKAELANPIQEAAYEAGRQDAIMSKTPLETGGRSEYSGINKTTETERLNNGAEEIHLRDGSQWAGSENTGGQIPGMEEGSGRNQSRKAEGRPADSETAALSYGRKVSTASLGIAGGSRKNTIRLVTGGNTKATTEARRIAKERGLRVILFAGNNMEITQADGSVVSARAFITGDRVFIRVDHADYTSDQLMRHEAGHDMIAKGEINPNDVRKRIAQSFGKEKAGQLADMYAEAYEGAGMSAEEVWEEVICDSLGDMNIFSKTAKETHAWELLKETKAASAETKNETSRAPPAEGKASVETWPDGKKYVRADRQVVYGNDPDAWSEQLEGYINGKIRRGEDVKLVAADGDILTLTKDTAGKVASPYAGAARMSDEAFERKVSAGAHIDELAAASVRGKRTAQDEDAKHGDMASGGWNYRTAYFLDFDNTYYECTISVSVGKNGNAVYNIGKMKKRSLPTVPKALTGSSVKDGAQRGKASIEANISHEAADVKGHFSRELDSNEDVQTAINQSMTMQQARDMVQRAFVLSGIKDWYEGEYRTGDEWLKAQGADEVAMYIDNEWTLQEKYLNKIQGLMDEEFLTSDILEAYLAGTLTGTQKQSNRPKRLNVAEGVSAQDNKFFAPRRIENAKAAYETACQKVTSKNRDAVNKARADVIMFAHTRGAAEALGLTQSELNKKLSAWARYTARARETSQRFNNGVADWNKWTGIENSNLLTKATVSNEDLEALVGEITGDNDGWQRKYIMRTMLALDTHIDYTGLKFEFVGIPDSNRRSVNGLYSDSERKIRVKYNAPNTVAHEMGHYLDYQWARDLGLHGALTESRRGTKSVSGEVKMWHDNFMDFIDSLTDGADLYSGYTMDAKEVFARFVDKFVRWVNHTANGEQTSAYTFDRNDKFTAQHYIEFVRLLQEKSMLDGKAVGETKFSRDLDSIERMQKDDAALREANREIKHLYNSGKLAKMDKATLTKFAKDIVKSATSKANAVEVTEQLRELHEYLIAGEDGNKGDWNTAYGMAYEIAADILENVSAIDDSMYQQYKELRNTIRTTGISISKEYDGDMRGYESLNDFRKANFGRIKLVNDGVGVDVFYQELANSYPEFFDETEYTNPADQLNHIAEVLDELKPFEVNPFSSNMGEATTWLAEDIMMRFYRVQNEKLAAAVKRGKDNALKARRREIAKRDEKIKTLKQKQRAKEAKMSQNRQAAILRAKIQRHIGPMKQKLDRPNDKQHVPQELRKAVAAMLDAINLESGYDYVPGSQHKTSRGATVGKRAEKGSGDPTKRTEEFRNVQELYKKIINEGEADDMVIDPALIGGEGNRSMLDEVIAMRDTPIANMSVAQLQTVWDCIRAIEHSISEAGKTLAKTKFATTKAFAEAFVKDTASRKAINRDMAADKRAKDLETPYTFFSRYGEAGMEFYRALRNAQDAEQIMQDELVERVGKVVPSEQKKKLEKETKVFTTVSGDELTLSKAHVMEIYLLNKREQARGHLTAGGIVQPESGKVKRGTEPVLLTEVDVLNIIGSLTEEEQKIADGLQKLTLWLAEKGNEASMKVYGYEKFGDPNYWTIRSANEQIAQTVEKNRDNPRSIANMGSAKPLTPNASNALDISGVFDTFSRHASDMLTYSAWLATMEDANRLFNFKFKDGKGNITGKNMQTLLNKVGGAASTNYWLELMKDIQNGIKSPADTGWEPVAAKIVANTKKASVSANIRVVIQQPTAIARATAVLNPAYLTAALGKDVAVKPAIDGWNKAVKYAPIASRKAAGGYEVSSNPKQLADLLYKPNTKKGKIIDGAKEAPLWLAGEADKVTWGTIWNACEMQVKAQNKGLEGEAFSAKVAELFTDVIDQTQVVDGVLQRSQAMRSGSSLMQQMTSFTGEPTMAANMVIRAYDNVRREQNTEKRKAGRKKLARTLGAYILTAGLNAFAQSIIDAMRDDEDDDKFWQKIKKHMWGITGKEEKFMDRIRNVLLAGNMANNLNPLTWIPILKDVVSIVQGYSVERMDAASLSDFFSDITLAARSLSGEGKYTVGYAMTKVMASGGKILGISVANIIRDVESVIDTIHFARNDIEGMYEVERLISTIPNNKARYVDLAYMAYVRGDMELHERIRQDMIAAGVDAGYIKTAMDNRMKKDYGIDDVKLLPQRYMTPEQQKSYDAVMDEVEKSSVWKNADARVRKNVSYDYYELVTGASAAEGMVAKMEAASKYGIDSVEFLLYEAALGMADKPNEKGSYGTFTNDEYIEAINAVPGLSKSEKSNFWEEVLGKSEKTNPWG